MTKINGKLMDMQKTIETSDKEIQIESVEHSLLSHPGVLNAELKATQGDKGDLLVADITLKRGYTPSNDLKSELAWHVSTDLEVTAIFKDINFLPRPPEVKTTLIEDAKVSENVVYIAGHGIDTKEVERILEGRDGVAEAKVSGIPDPKKGEVLIAEIKLANDCESTEDLKRELAWFVQIEMGHIVVFRDIHFSDEEPKEPGKTPVREDMVIVDGIEKDGDEIHISSHKISTTEVTRVLLKHPDISDAAVVTVPDDNAGEKMKAFLRLKDGVEPSNDLKLELAWFVMTELKPISVFKNIDLGTHVPELPLETLDSNDEEIIDISGFTILSDDVEIVLRGHDLVSEAVVIGVPDKIHGEVLEAFVSLIEGAIPSGELKEELAWLARTEIGPEVVFRTIKFRKFLPKTENKKILRSIIKADTLDMAANISITIAD